jgi:predicted NBD/HSP70 family sugar kinase
VSTFHSTSHVRTANAAHVIRLLRDHGAMSRAELVRASGLARPTVMAIVKSLLQEGLAIESGTVAPTANGGRPGTLVWFNSEARTAIAARFGFEIELTHVTASGAVLARETFPSPREPGALLALAAREIRRMTSASGALSSVALAVPGFIDHPAGTVTFAPLGWARTPIQAPLEAELGVPVGLISLPAATLVGEIISGVAAGHDDAVLVFLAHGIGAGILSRGRIVVGTGGAVGELGHCPVSSGLPCTCGRDGCLETVAAGWAIRAAASARLARPERASAELGAATAWLVNLLDPSIVIFADTPFTDGAGAFFETFDASTRAHAVTTADLTIVRGSADARLRGTVQSALELLPERLRPRRIVCA